LPDASFTYCDEKYKNMNAETPKLLLIDDREDNLLALEVMLADRNYRLIRAISGTHALKILLQEKDFALILIDARMPILDGFETATMIRQNAKLKHVPIIFLTAQGNEPDDIFKGYQAGAVDYILKPLSPEILKAKIAVFVDLYLKNQELVRQSEHMKILNRQLLQQSEYARNLIEASLDPLITINSLGKITDVNRAMENITGIPRNMLIGTYFFNHFTEPDKACKVYEVVFEKGSIVDCLLTIRHKEGPLIEVLFNGSVYKDEKGKVLGVVVVAREKLLSKYARTLIEASLDPLITLNSTGQITDINRALEVITGMTRDQIVGSNFSDYFIESAKAGEIYKEVFAKGFVRNYPLTLRNKNQKLVDVLFNGSVYKDNRGNILGAVTVARDVTAQKIVEKELIEAKRNAECAQQIAEDAMKAKQQFLANMSHEIRTPMNAIVGFTKVILKTKLSETQREYLNAIKTSGDSLIVLINDILDLAKVNAGKMTFESIPFQLAPAISSMLLLFETKLKENRLELIQHYDSMVPGVLVGDAVRLQQILMNLLSNAVKFTMQGKITVGVRLVKEDDENATVEFSVTDTGIGIPEDQTDKIFDNFQQANSKTNRLFGGTGLGLAIVKQLVEAQQGTLTVTSKVGEGSTFSFILNFKKTSLQIETETELGWEHEPAIKNIKILLAEDIKLNQLLIKTMLNVFGFEIHVAVNGKVAIEKLKKNKYDLVLMDLQMPEMDGFEATEYIRKNIDTVIPIIALTADVTSVDLEKCRAIGMNDYISKPVDEKTLYHKIMRYIQKDKDPRENGGTAQQVQDCSTTPQKAKCINMDFLERMTKGNPEMITEMVNVYLEETPKMISRIRHGIKMEDWDLVARTAHSFMPSFTTMGMNKEFVVMTKKISDYAAKREHTDKIKELFLKIESVCLQARKELEQELLLMEKR
jgi:PAS domain S-box-containing protein